MFERGEMKNKIFKKNNEAVAGVIEALLIVALVAIILSTVQLVFIPQVMEQREADHMDEVQNQFSYIKSVIDLQSMTKEDVPISSPVKLGNKNIPYFVTMGARGDVRIIEDESYDINIDFDTLILPLTSIKYTAYNYYYLGGDDLIYAIEGGAVILKQYDGEVVKVEPGITVQNLTGQVNPKVNIYYELPIIIGIPGKNITPASDEIIYIRTNYSSSDANWNSITDVTSLKITTEYAAAWKSLLEEYLEENVNYILGTDDVEITKKGSTTINFYYKRTNIYAQVSPGWIKT